MFGAPLNRLGVRALSGKSPACLRGDFVTRIHWAPALVAAVETDFSLIEMTNGLGDVDSAWRPKTGFAWAIFQG